MSGPMSAAAAAHSENAEGMTAQDCEPNVRAESSYCRECEYGHGEFVCRWCLGVRG